MYASNIAIGTIEARFSAITLILREGRGAHIVWYNLHQSLSALEGLVYPRMALLIGTDAVTEL